MCCDEKQIKQEDESSINLGAPPPKKRRGRKRKIQPGSAQKDDLELLSEKMRQRNERILSSQSRDIGFIGIKTVDGCVEIPIPAQIKVEYEIFGDACTDKIEDILQAKGRTRYVRGLSEREKKDRRREQNRNAAARSRARKNAMISKVIQLHHENLGLRSYTARTISDLKNLRDQNHKLRQLLQQKQNTNNQTK